jgi:Cdc6-like AAA superfamily ATPase
VLADIRAQLSDTLRNTDEIVHYHHTQEEERILDWLPTVDYDPQQSIFSKLEQGTGQWFLNSAGYRDWLETDKQTLFCTGIPGAGKTFITSIVIDHLQTNYKNSSIAYLYFSVGQQGQQTVKELLGSLLKQLVRNQSPLPQVVKNLYGRHKERRSQPELREISGVLQSVISPDSRTFFIIDALDECQSIYRDTFLTEIFSIQKNTRLSLFATSRPQEVEVDAKFNGSIVQEIVASDKDIETYVDHQILLWNRSHKNHNLDDIQNTIKAEITLAAAGM